MQTNIGITRVELTNDQIKALPTTYIEAVPAPGAGKGYAVLTAMLQWNVSAGAYTNINAENIVFLGYGDWNENASTFTKVPTSTANKLQILGSYSSNGTGDWVDNTFGLDGNSPASIENQPLKIICDNSSSGNLTGGNAANTLVVTVIYIVVDL